MTDLSDTIARVEAATGPDRRLDAEVACAVVFRDLRPAEPDDHKEYQRGYLPSRGDIWTPTGFLMADNYTSSINAALTLLPKGMEFELTNLYGVAAVGMGLNTGSPCYARREDGNITLALLSAILRARQAMQMEASS